MAMRICTGILATAALLFTVAALGLLGTWALSVATVMGLVGTCGVVTVMEGRDFASSGATPAELRPSHLRVAGLAGHDDQRHVA